MQKKKGNFFEGKLVLEKNIFPKSFFFEKLLEKYFFRKILHKNLQRGDY